MSRRDGCCCNSRSVEPCGWCGEQDHLADLRAGDVGEPLCPCCVRPYSLCVCPPRPPQRCVDCHDEVLRCVCGGIPF